MRDAKVIAKVVLNGEIILESPLMIGTGDNDNYTDILILKDKDNNPYIPGTSFAGVLRKLNETKNKYFGVFHGKDSTQCNEEVMQSSIVTSDIVLHNTKVVIRDSVAIEPILGVGKKGGKFDYEVVERGANGKFNLEITIRKFQEKEEVEIIECVRNIGQELLQGVFVGAKTTNGFGKIVAKENTVKMGIYDFSDYAAVKAWLKKEASPTVEIVKKVEIQQSEDFILQGDFFIESSLLVRSDNVDNDNNCKINSVSMSSGNDFVIPGSTVKGVIRNQAYNIFSTLKKLKNSNKEPNEMLDELFGTKDDVQHKAHKGNMVAEEIYLQNGVSEHPQTRNKIDRFTGATINGALFTEIPLWQETVDQATVSMRITIKECKEWQAGLMLFILRDIWQGKVAFGGEKSVGRGTLTGIHASISFKNKKYDIFEHGSEFKLTGNKAELENYATKFFQYVDGGRN